MKRVLKILVAIALLAALVYGVEWSEVPRLLARVTVWTLLVVAAAMVWELGLSAAKWSWALRIHGLRFDFAYLFRSICTGYFLNNFLPTAIGGDAYRVYRTLPSDGYRSRALSAVILERGVGFGALLALGSLGAIALWNVPVARTYLYVLGAVSAAGAAVLLVLSLGGLSWLKARLLKNKVVDALEHNVSRMLRARSEWVYLLALSFSFQATSILIVLWLFTQLGYDVTLQQCALMAAASGLAALLPLSINGIGLMEGSLVGMAIALGVEYEAALLVAVIRRLMMALISALCGVAYLVEPKALPTASASPL